jgi:hypothetical protein
MVWAMSGAIPLTMETAPISRAASTVWTRWLATLVSTEGTPVTSITTTVARLLRTERNNCSVS